MWRKSFVLLIACCLLFCVACSAKTPMPENTQAPEASGFVLPDDIRVGAEGVPQLRVYIQAEKEIREMDLETYIQGVLAGEMKNDWPMEALKAQAILARTFVIRFITEKQSKYAGADVSTDIEEAQAYDAAGINDRIREAVQATRGQIVCYGGEPIYAWFHAHAGGRTATAAEGLSYKKEAPYTLSTDSHESEKAPEDDAAWTTAFSLDDVIKAAADAGVKVSEPVRQISMGEKGISGRVKTLLIGTKPVPANEFRIAIGSEKMKSTLLTDISYENETLTLSGMGYGHGVGMSQWGAYAMAEEGKDAGEIIQHYFQHVDIVQMWK